MSLESIESFVDNWAYLKTELNWLERLLMMAVARQRKDSKDIDRLSRSSADKATSHWWKGVISLEGAIAYDEFRKTATLPATKSYQQQLDSRIKLTQERGIVLALPLLCGRLGLSVFEKNLLLMGIAPEVNRRYARLYHYLQDDGHANKTDLPTVDLVLRLMCRNDEEWRQARSRLVRDSPLLRYDLLRFVSDPDNTFLAQAIKLSDDLVDYVLAEQPTPDDLKAVLRRRLPSAQPSLLRSQSVNTAWEALVLPGPQQDTLKRLATLTRQGLTVPRSSTAQIGQIALLSGAPGTGKTLAAQAIATELGTPLVSVDLATLETDAYPTVLHELSTVAPPVLLICASEHWLRRSSPLSAPALQQWLTQRRSQPGLTLFSVSHPEAVALTWRNQIGQAIALPLPDARNRQVLWQRAFPPEITVDKVLDWAALAAQLVVTGKEIQAIAQTAQLLAAAASTTDVSLELLLQALAQHGYRLNAIPQLATARKRRSPSPKSLPEPDKPKPTTRRGRSQAVGPQADPRSRSVS